MTLGAWSVDWEESWDQDQAWLAVLWSLVMSAVGMEQKVQAWLSIMTEQVIIGRNFI